MRGFSLRRGRGGEWWWRWGWGAAARFTAPYPPHFLFCFIRIADLLIGFFIFALFIPFNPPFAFLKLGGWRWGWGVKTRAPRTKKNKTKMLFTNSFLVVVVFFFVDYAF